MPFDNNIFAEVRAAVKRDMYSGQVNVNKEMQRTFRDAGAQQQLPETTNRRTSAPARARARTPATV